MSPVNLVTISREFGAGGSQFATALGARLGWPVLDQEIPDLVAHRLGVERDEVEARDEHAPGLLERIGTAMLRTSPDFAAAPVELPRAPIPDDIARATREVLDDAAESPPLVIVGHGTQALFHGRPGAFHIRLFAPLDARVRRVCARAGCGDEDAVALARRMDADRIAYVRRYYRREWADPSLYDLMLNTGSIELEDAVRVVGELIERSRVQSMQRARG